MKHKEGDWVQLTEHVIEGFVVHALKGEYVKILIEEDDYYIVQTERNILKITWWELTECETAH